MQVVLNPAQGVSSDGFITVTVPNLTYPRNVSNRLERGQRLAADKAVKETKMDSRYYYYETKSSHPNPYEIRISRDGSRATCTCPDAPRHGHCKHRYAAMLEIMHRKLKGMSHAELNKQNQALMTNLATALAINEQPTAQPQRFDGRPITTPRQQDAQLREQRLAGIRDHQDPYAYVTTEINGVDILDLID